MWNISWRKTSSSNALRCRSRISSLGKIFYFLFGEDPVFFVSSNKKVVFLDPEFSHAHVEHTRDLLLCVSIRQECCSALGFVHSECYCWPPSLVSFGS